MAKSLALSLRKWHKKNQIGENGGERKKNPSANPGENQKFGFQTCLTQTSLYSHTSRLERRRGIVLSV